MPLVLQHLPMGNLLGFMWFFLLFIAGITSSISLAQPAIAFLEDEFNLSRAKASIVFAGVTFLMCQGAIFGLGKGVLDELDFWGGNFCLVLFGTVETILFAWVYGMDKAWTEMHVGADIAIPRVYRFIIKYITPFALIALLIGWMYQEGWKTITMAEAKAANRPYILLTRLSLLAFFVALSVLVWVSWRRRAAKAAAAIPGSESKCA